ncbi:hypothetical protein K1T71_009151 [Dendrolimus kikuchii]|uniref:Uncharacterized protein n=1 Tax=Dendrolimus kikuchii TaxID=765133 RepID=A0ACC1CU90_9NEOP|nr:hypothetical protein K1T71_009151 [Dendrolimus kikuchii]
MSHARTFAFICACALLVIVTEPALVPPRREHKEMKMVHDRAILVRRLPKAYYYPFSLWPIPKVPVDAEEVSAETFYYRRSLNRQRKNMR